MKWKPIIPEKIPFAVLKFDGPEKNAVFSHRILFNSWQTFII
jgi:hypothetical protein